MMRPVVPHTLFSSDVLCTFTSRTLALALSFLPLDQLLLFLSNVPQPLAHRGHLHFQQLSIFAGLEPNGIRSVLSRGLVEICFVIDHLPAHQNINVNLLNEP